MNDRQKNAALILRILGAGYAAVIIINFAARFVEAALNIPIQEYPLHTIVGNIAYLLGGILLASLSKPIGRLLGRGLE